MSETELNYLRTQLQRNNKIDYNDIETKYRLAGQYSTKIEDNFLHVQTLVSEANEIVKQMNQNIFYHVITRISNSYLKPNERTIENLIELAIEVRRNQTILQVWDIETFELKLCIIKEAYHSWTQTNTLNPKYENIFIDLKQTEMFIGVANIHLKALLYGMKIDYIVPIINTQGKISGSLHVVLNPSESFPLKRARNFQINSTTQRSISDGISVDIDEQSLNCSQTSLEDEGIDDYTPEELVVKFAIKEARDLPKIEGKYVICRYAFINPNLDQTVRSKERKETSQTFIFDHDEEYHFPLTDDFLRSCLDGAISIEIWSENSVKNQNNEREISQRWKHAREHVQLTVQIQEIDQDGQWNSMEIDSDERIPTGGIYRLKQGQTKRIKVGVNSITRTDRMPLKLDDIRSIEIGSISSRKLTDADEQLDSYQEKDLNDLKHQWLNEIEKKKFDIDSKIKEINSKETKSLNDIQREEILVQQTVYLSQEKAIVISPPVASGIPGAPSNWQPPSSVELHRPMIYLNIETNKEMAGCDAHLDGEHPKTMLSLPLIQTASDSNQAIAAWNPSIHESDILNQVTPSDTVIYLIVKITILISEPKAMELVLRKRLAVTISKGDSWWMKKFVSKMFAEETFRNTSVVYEIVSHLPKLIFPIDNESYSSNSIDKYLDYASTIDTLLLIDKFRQEVLLAEQPIKQPLAKKSKSVPQLTVTPETPVLNADLYKSTASLSSRTSFIENEHIEPINKSKFEIVQTIDLDEIQTNVETITEKYSLSPSPSLSDSVRKLPTTNEIPEFTIGSRVLINTGHSIINKSGIIRYIGEIIVQKGLFYGIELDEPVGKNNGSLKGQTYFQCEANHGTFVLADKIRLIN